MKLSLRLGQLLKAVQSRGLITDMHNFTKLERHTISALMRNSAKYVSLDALGKICDFLIAMNIVNPSQLPGALFALEREEFWSMIADRDRTEICLAARAHPDYPGREHVMAVDTRLQGVLLTQISINSAKSAEANSWRYISDQHLVKAPRPVRNSEGVPTEIIEDGREHAKDIFKAFRKRTDRGGLIAIGSVKVQSVLELMLANTFAAKPFVSQDNVYTPDQRACPFFFRYRPFDVTPVSLCGGNTLSQKIAPTEPGIYYEQEDESWTCCPEVKDKQDVAFMFYAYRPGMGELQLACGGFTGTATRLLAGALPHVEAKLLKSQYNTPELQVALHLITFDLKQSPPKWDVITVPENAIARRIA